MSITGCCSSHQRNPTPETTVLVARAVDLDYHERTSVRSRDNVGSRFRNRRPRQSTRIAIRRKRNG